MAVTEETYETIHKIPIPTHHYVLLTAPDGTFVVPTASGGWTTTDVADDKVIWDRVSDGTVRHVVSKRELPCTGDNGTAQALVTTDTSTLRCAVEHGPELLPSEYLATIREQGWVCLTNILPDSLVEELERVACTDRYADRQYDVSRPALCQNPAIAKTAAEPISLWVIRQYMQTTDIHFSHPPAFAILKKDDGVRNVQGWHSDYPYHWGIPAQGKVPTPSRETVLGVQRNTCVSEFSKQRGATIFKLGSHALETPPPAEWGDVTTHIAPGYREKHGLPYGGPEADIVEAPGGSIILYDSRTWHRQGVNRSDLRRAAMLQAVTPMYVMPKNDTSIAYRAFLDCEIYPSLPDRVHRELSKLMVPRFIGPGGTYAIAPDRELTTRLREGAAASTGY